MKRIKVARKEANPLFERWLKEWKEDAIVSGSDLQYHFSRALISLRKYPLPLKSGKDCIILRHFGAKLCAMLEKKLSEHYKQPGESCSRLFNLRPTSPTEHSKTLLTPSKEKRISQRDATELQGTHQAENASLQTITRSWDVYCYVLLFILYRKTRVQVPSSGRATQTEISIQVQHTFIDWGKMGNSVESFERNIKLSIDRLIEHGFVRRGEPGLSLTKRGESLAEKICFDRKTLEDFRQLYGESSGHEFAADVNVGQMMKLLAPLRNALGATNSATNSSDAAGGDLPPVSPDFGEAVKEHEEIHLRPNSFEIVLLIDTQEVPGKKSELPEDIDKVSQSGVLFEVRNLKVGDFLWVARCRNTKKELVLPYIVERKRIDDLSASIVDGRFHEQKFRLRKSGIGNIIYIVESYGKNVRTAVSPSALMQASTNSVVQHGFIVKYTNDHCGTMSYLASVSKHLRRMHEGRTLTTSLNYDGESVLLQEFENFNKSSSKNKSHTVEEMFVRQLLQLKGVSVKKATAIVKRHPTPRALANALRESAEDAEKVIGDIQREEKGRQMIGIASSKVIYEFYTRRELT